MDEIQVENDFMRVRRSRIDRETKTGRPTLRSQRDKTDARSGSPFLAFVQNGDMSAFGPSSSDDRNEREVGFIPEKNGPTVFMRLFLYEAKHIESNVRPWPDHVFSTYGPA